MDTRFSHKGNYLDAIFRPNESPLEVVCWSRMQAEAGQELRMIIARKELERRAGGGLFFWGVGNAPGRVPSKLARASVLPAKFGSPEPS